MMYRTFPVMDYSTHLQTLFKYLEIVPGKHVWVNTRIQYPLTVKVHDYNDTERIGTCPKISNIAGPHLIDTDQNHAANLVDYQIFEQVYIRDFSLVAFTPDTQVFFRQQAFKLVDTNTFYTKHFVKRTTAHTGMIYPFPANSGRYIFLPFLSSQMNEFVPDNQ